MVQTGDSRYSEVRSRNTNSDHFENAIGKRFWFQFCIPKDAFGKLFFYRTDFRLCLFRKLQREEKIC